MKIGILTFHRCINYGSFWQAYNLSNELRKRGHSTFILDHRSRKVDFREFRCALRPLAPASSHKDDHYFYRRKVDKFFKAFRDLALSPAFDLEDPSRIEEYDLILVGSDEVWNLAHPWYRNYPVFFGDGLSSRVVSYAASFGNYDASFMLGKEWSDRLRKFDKISVRDENSRNIVRNSLGIDPHIIIDPCLQFRINIERKDTFIAYKPYVAVYGHSFTESIIREVVSWSRRRKLPLVSIGYRNDWADEQWLNAGPYEFASFIKQSDAVITNFFHGCIFALNNMKPFICETMPYRSIKIKDLMERTGGMKHLFSGKMSGASFNSLLSDPPEERIYTTIGKLRKDSDAFLNTSLEPATIKQHERVTEREKYR